MRAAWFADFGAARDVLQIGEIETPVPAAGEVLVRLACSGVNPSDVKKRAGSFPDLLKDGFVIPNSDGAGVVEAVGDGVPESRVGERVWVYQAQFARRFGTAAEYVAIASERAPRLPGAATFETGACMGIPAMTAHRCVFADGDPAGKTVLVTGGAGRVGYYAIQWAANAGANVLATASNAEDEAACRDAGALHIANHRDDSWAEVILSANDGQLVDLVVDVEFGSNLGEVLKLIRTGGVINTYSSTVVPRPELPFFDMMYKDITLRMVIVYAMPEAAKQAAIEDISTALEQDNLVHRIADTMPLDEIARANELIEAANCRGSVVLDTS